MFGGIGPWELILVFVVVLLLFGAKRLPEIGSSLGKGIREFKSSFREIEGELKMPEDEPRGSVAPPRAEPRKEPHVEPRREGESGTGEAHKLHSSQ